MKFINNVRERFSLRNYDQRQPEREKIEYVLECARLAPSAVNRQPWHLIIAQSPEAREKLYACYPREWFRTAPIIIAVCTNHDSAWTRPCDGKNHADIDAAIITEHICLAATDAGLGTCWVCNFDYEATCRALDLPAGMHPVALIPIGYPAQGVSIPPKNRNTIAQLTEWR